MMTNKMHFKNSLIKMKILKICTKNSKKLKNLNKMTSLENQISINKLCSNLLINNKELI